MNTCRRRTYGGKKMATYTIYSNQGTPNVYFDGAFVGVISNGVLEVEYKDIEVGVNVTLDNISSESDTYSTYENDPYANIVTGSIPPSNIDPLTESFYFSFDLKTRIDTTTTHYTNNNGNVTCLPNSSVNINYISSNSVSSEIVDREIKEVLVFNTNLNEYGMWDDGSGTNATTDNSHWSYTREDDINGILRRRLCVKIEKVGTVWAVTYRANDFLYYNPSFVQASNSNGSRLYVKVKAYIRGTDRIFTVVTSNFD